MRFVVQGLTYPEAVELMQDLRNAGIECGETAGAIAIYPDEGQLTRMTEFASNMMRALFLDRQVQKNLWSNGG